MLIKHFLLRFQNGRWKQRDKNNYDIVAKNHLQSTTGKRHPPPLKLQIHQKTLWAEKKQELVLKSLEKGPRLPHVKIQTNWWTQTSRHQKHSFAFLCISMHKSQTSPRHSQTPIYSHTNTFLKVVRGTGPLHGKQKRNLSGPLSMQDRHDLIINHGNPAAIYW